MVKSLLILSLYYLSFVIITKCYQTGDKMLAPLIVELHLRISWEWSNTYICGVDRVAAGEDELVLDECTVYKDQPLYRNIGTLRLMKSNVN